MSDHKPWAFVLHTCETIDDISEGDDWTLHGADGTALLFESAPASLNAVAFNMMCNEITDLRTRLEAAEKDAARYRFLCHNFESGFDCDNYAWWYNNRGELTGECETIFDVPNLDESIDAQLKEVK